MFPTANSSIIRNEDGEVIGWDTPSADDIDWEGRLDDIDPSDYEDIDPADCDHSDRSSKDIRTGHPSLAEMPTREAIVWECDRCLDLIEMTDEEFEDYMNN